jgi:hypothetical protein
MAEVGRTHRGHRARARGPSPREVVGVLNARDGTSEGETVCAIPRGFFHRTPEESASYVKACEDRSRRKAFWIVHNARSSPGVRAAVLTHG